MTTFKRSAQEKGRLPPPPVHNAPAVILVEPQLAENMGTTARAMVMDPVAAAVAREGIAMNTYKPPKA